MSQNNLRPEYTAMATPQKEKDTQFSVMSLLSPPETKRPDTFSSPMSMAMSRQSSSSFSTIAQPARNNSNYAAIASKESRPGLLSPPISPQTFHKDEVAREDEGTQDPVLFSSQESKAVVDNRPLFPQNNSEADEIDAAIKRHQAATGNYGNFAEERAFRDTIEALSAMKFQTNVYERYRRDPVAYRKECMQSWDFYDNARRAAKAKKEAEQKAASKQTPQQRRLAPAPEGGIRKKVTVPRVARNPPKRRAPPAHQFSSFSFPVGVEAAPKAPKQPTNRDDVAYDSVPDYCPPTEDLRNNSKALKADWKGQMLDLSADPDRNLLIDAEINLAATLRLSCATYLTSKRRIFEARVACFAKGKEFRKTDAQQACKIDVNKASKLWTAFEKVGWFDKKHFFKHM